MEQRDFDITGPIKKVTTSTILIMPPRKFWPRIQELRTPNSFELRTGPHITLVYPFIHEKLLGDAATLLAPVVAKIKPFRVRLDSFGIFDNDGDINIHFKPIVRDRNLHTLQKAIEKVFPHCNDVDIITDEGFTPHMSIGGFKGDDAKERADAIIAKYTPLFQEEPIEFIVTEIYICARVGNDPFEVRYVLSLDSARIDAEERPYFGPKSPHIPNILFVGNLPRSPDFTSESLKPLFPTCTDITIWKQPDDTSRGCAWIIFPDGESAHNAYATASRRNLKIGQKGQEPTIILASRMAYP